MWACSICGKRARVRRHTQCEGMVNLRGVHRSHRLFSARTGTNELAFMCTRCGGFKTGSAPGLIKSCFDMCGRESRRRLRRIRSGWHPYRSTFITILGRVFGWREALVVGVGEARPAGGDVLDGMFLATASTFSRPSGVRTLEGHVGGVGEPAAVMSVEDTPPPPLPPEDDGQDEHVFDDIEALACLETELEAAELARADDDPFDFGWDPGQATVRLR